MEKTKNSNVKGIRKNEEHEKVKNIGKKYWRKESGPQEQVRNERKEKAITEAVAGERMTCR